MFECTAVMPDGTVITVSGTFSEMVTWADEFHTEHDGCRIDIKEISK